MRSLLSAKTFHYMGRDAVLLAQDKARVVIDLLGGMMPEFSVNRERGFLNAHWIPDFRGNAETLWSDREHLSYWKAKLLYNIAGDFPCVPNFGGECRVDDIEMPIHGFSANEMWTLKDLGVSEEESFAWARFSLESPNPSYTLSLYKTDIIFHGQPAYFSILSIRNSGERSLSITVGRHNTLGSPFLQAGCKISLAANHFATPPADRGTEEGGRLDIDTEFECLNEAPLRNGGIADISYVPGMIGTTDFITGAIPLNLGIGWSCVVNPVLCLAYVSFFPGAIGLPKNEIALGFNDLWMQYGGRKYTPWALHEGGADRTFCLGAENATAGFANGLSWSLSHPKILGKDTFIEIPAGCERRLYYGTALLDISPELVSEGVTRVEAEESALILIGKRSSIRFQMDAIFVNARRLYEALERGQIRSTSGEVIE